MPSVSSAVSSAVKIFRRETPWTPWFEDLAFNHRGARRTAASRYQMLGSRSQLSALRSREPNIRIPLCSSVPSVVKGLPLCNPVHPVVKALGRILNQSGFMRMGRGFAQSETAYETQ